MSLRSASRSSRRRFASATAAVAVAGLTLGLTGCLSIVVRTRKVDKTIRAEGVLDATLEQLNSALAEQYAAIKTINASVEIKASTGGEHEGEVKEIPSFSGYILLRKPSDLRIIMQLPVVRSLALDAVSDGKNFKLVIPPKSIAREGSEEVSTPSKKGFENLRPNIIREALLVPEVLPDEVVNLVQGSRIIPPAPGKKESTEEPDYDLTISRHKNGNENETVRVVHIGRVTLKPYEQDIYDHSGRLVTVVTYDKYQKFGDVAFPMSILITRPIDEYALQINITKLTLNQAMDDEQFVLKFPDNATIQKMP